MPGFTILATAAAVGDMAASSSSDNMAPVPTHRYLVYFCNISNESHEYIFQIKNDTYCTLRINSYEDF